MRALLFPLCLIFSFFAGFQIAKHTPEKNKNPLSQKELESYIEKPFTLVVYAYNQDLWIERALRSIFEQDYENYQVILIDDGSSDNTFEVAQNCILEANQSARVFLIQNEKKQGYFSALHGSIQSLLDQEIVLPILAKDWFTETLALKKMNAAFHDPNVWIAKARSIQFPSYEDSTYEIEAFYAKVFKELPPQTLQKIEKESASLGATLKKKTAQTQDILLISNRAAVSDTFAY